MIDLPSADVCLDAYLAEHPPAACGALDLVGVALVEDTRPILALRQMFCVPLPTLSYQMLVHEAGHAARLGLDPPWDPTEVDRLLMQLSPAARVREEIVVALIAARLAALCGMPAGDPLEEAAGVGVVARMNEQDNRGSVAAVLGLALRLLGEAADGKGPLRDRAKVLMPLARRQARRQALAVDFDAVARRIGAMIGAPGVLAIPRGAPRSVHRKTAREGPRRGEERA